MKNQILAMPQLKWLVNFLMWVSVFLAPVQNAMAAVLALVCADLIVGIWAATKRKERIMSYGLRRTISKLLAYELAVISSWIVEVVFMPGVPLTRAAAGFASTVELKSVYENVSQITGINMWDRVKTLLQGAPSAKNQ